MNQAVLKQIAQKLDEHECLWGVGGSVVLHHFGLVASPNDIDLLVKAKDALKIKTFMDDIGKPLPRAFKEPFRTEAFFAYDIDGLRVEFLGDFKIKLADDTTYEFILDEQAICEKMVIDDYDIKLTTLEDWFVAYQVMKDPKKRVPLIKQYFKTHQISHRHLLTRNLNQNPLPEVVKQEINDLLARNE